MEGDPAGGGAEARVRSSNLGGRVSERKREGVLNETGPNQTRFARSQPTENASAVGKTTTALQGRTFSALVLAGRGGERVLP